MDGSLPSLMIRDIKSKLCDSAFQHKLDGLSTGKYIQFDCGHVWNCQAMKLQAGVPDLFISQSTHYHYPTEGLAKIRDKLLLKGIHVSQ